MTILNLIRGFVSKVNSSTLSFSIIFFIYLEIFTTKVM